MTFDEVLAQVRELLQSKGRVAYRALKRRFELDEEYLEDLKAELIDAEHVACDEDGRVLVWTGSTTIGSSSQPLASQTADSASRTPNFLSFQTLDAQREAERRQLTVMFCDLVGSTVLSEQLDPEELREVVRAYHETCASVISRYGGYTAQHLGDGLLVYFGYPAAHEDDAQRGMRTGLEILAGLQTLNAGLPSTIKARLPHPVQVRIGVHTGLVVIGEVGSSEKREILALGETPNLAARIQGQAEPDTMVISGATYRLVQGLFECQDRGRQELKGFSTSLPLYRVVREGAAQSRFEAAVQKGLTPLVGREHEVGLLQERWEQAKQGAGQVVLLGGEPGIGKSRLVQELKDRVTQAGAPRIEFQCSAYHRNSALYPIIERLQHVFQFERADSLVMKLEKLKHVLSHYRFLQADTLPLLAALLSLPHPEGYPPITVSPQKQKEKTHAALVAWLVEEAERQPVCNTWEDVHWADPSTREVLNLVVDQAPTARLYVLLTFRPEFMPPWGNRSHISQLALSRLGRPQIEAMVERVMDGKTLPPEVVEQIVAKTDGVPLFVEELTKTVMESGLLTAVDDHYELSGPLPALAIPSTLQDSLMARLDRLSTVREIAQLGATIGREFSYELLQAVSPLDEERLQHGLRQLVEAELIYQRGMPPRATYLFKHALVQDTAYQSLLKSKRQQYHQQIAQVLAERFPETVQTQPELLAHHYTEAGLIAQAIPYWQQAGQRASQRSASVEAISHLTKGLELLKTLPDTPERIRQELTLQITLGVPLIATRGYGASEVQHAFIRARELSQQMGESPQLFLVLRGLWNWHLLKAELWTACELGEQLLALAQCQRDPSPILEAHRMVGTTLFFQGELISARTYLEQGISLYDRQQHRSLAFLYGADPGVICQLYTAWILGLIGYPDQALNRVHDALNLARELSHPFSLAFTLSVAACVHHFLRERQAAQELAEANIILSTEQRIAQWLASGTMLRGWTLALQGRGEEGIIQIHEGLAAWQNTGANLVVPYYLSLLVEAYGRAGQVREGLGVLTEALDLVHRNGERWYEAELYRLKGQLTLQKFQVSGSKFQVANPQPQTPNPQAEAEECFQKAIEIARRQQAKSLELRAVMSLIRLWQQQGKKKEARQLLAEIYGWFTEGFDTKDLQEAKALLDELS